MIGPHLSLPPRQVFTLELKNDWICASVMVLLSVNTASLMMFPALNPTSEVFTGPPGARATTGEEADATDADAAETGAAVPSISAKTATRVASHLPLPNGREGRVPCADM